MNDSEFDKAVRQEKNKINRELKSVKISPHKMKILLPIIDNVALMKVKLEDLREQITGEEFMVEYDNGGGQKGIKENPIFKRYEAFFKTYMIGMDRILASIPDEDKQKEVVDEEAAPETVIDRLQEKHRDKTCKDRKSQESK